VGEVRDGFALLGLTGDREDGCLLATKPSRGQAVTEIDTGELPPGIVFISDPAFPGRETKVVVYK
jgi:hypothetical protein